jgi:hypothetical protein
MGMEKKERLRKDEDDDDDGDADEVDEGSEEVYKDEL